MEEGGIHGTGKQFFHIKFPEFILNSTHTIVQREMLTIMISVKKWSSMLRGKVVRFSTDNENCMFAINNGRSKDPFILQCIRELAWVTAKNEILLRASFVSSHANTLPDALS